MKQVDETLQAVALRFDRSVHDAPTLTAKGSGYVAEQIIEAARAHGVPIQQDAQLVQVLARLELDQQIPPMVYQAVAEILSFLNRANQTASR